MKRRLSILSLIPPLLFLAVSLSGCALEPAAEVPADNPENISETGLATRTARPVALEDALGEMYSLMDAIDAGEGTRSAGRRNVASVELLGAKQLSQAATRSGEPILDSLLYLVNFVEGGFAVLGADESLASVIALTAAGQINAGDFDIPSTAVDYTLDDLWMEEDQDYLLGGVDASSGTGFVARMILDYAVNGWNPGGLGIDDGTGNDSGDGGGGEGPVTPVLPPGGGGNPDPYTYRYGEWVIDTATTVRAMLTTRWHQDSPFNDLAPYRTFFNERSDAGCIAIAVMQILAFHQTPETTAFDGLDISLNNHKPFAFTDVGPSQPMIPSLPWANLPNRSIDFSLDSEKNTAAWISRYIGYKCHMWYNVWQGASFATPQKAANAMKSAPISYTSVKKHKDYDELTIKNSVIDGRPVFIGKTEGSISSGHAWVIDGYMERYRSKIRIHKQTGVETVISERAETQKLFHCNWGWGNRANGYYVCGMFNPNKGADFIDTGDSNNSSGHDYDSDYCRIVTYELPSN